MGLCSLLLIMNMLIWQQVKHPCNSMCSGAMRGRVFWRSQRTYSCKPEWRPFFDALILVERGATEWLDWKFAHFITGAIFKRAACNHAQEKATHKHKSRELTRPGWEGLIQSQEVKSKTYNNKLGIRCPAHVLLSFCHGQHYLLVMEMYWSV